MVPGCFVMPATCEDFQKMAYQAGIYAAQLATSGRKASDIVTMRSFKNAIKVHATITGSTNSLLHIPFIAHEFGYELDADTFDRLHKNASYLLDIRPSGKWPAEYLYYAGGVPRIMEEIKDQLDLDVLTITGKTLGENLEDLKTSGYYERCDELLAQTGLKCTAIIRSMASPIGKNGLLF